MLFLINNYFIYYFGALKLTLIRMGRISNTKRAVIAQRKKKNSKIKNQRFKIYNDTLLKYYSTNTEMIYN